MIGSDRRLVIAGGEVLLLGVTLLASAALLGTPSAAPPDTGAAALASGTELVAAFVVTSSCGFCRDERLPGIVRAVGAALRERAASEGKTFAFIGVGLDHRPKDAIDFLERFGPFDELVVGRGWLNGGSLAFMIRGTPGMLGTPQLVLMERDVSVERQVIEVSADRLLGSLDS